MTPAAPLHHPLPPPARYRPWLSGRYETGPGLHRLGTDFGNGRLDGHLFQVDCEWPGYLEAKHEARAEALHKYVATALAPGEEGALARFIIETLSRESPDLFTWTPVSGGGRLHCRPSGEILEVDGQGRLQAARGGGHRPPYAGVFDALACQVQEDLVLVRVDGGDSVCALHVCFPNHWAPADKLGQDFAALHAPVPGMERTRARGPVLLQAALEKGPYVRFAWGLATDTRLNHHPEPPPGHDPEAWQGRRFDPSRPRLFVRVERQALSGLPGTRLVLFTIRTRFTDVTALDDAELDALVRALDSMSPAQRRYKGLAAHWPAVRHWLDALAARAIP